MNTKVLVAKEIKVLDSDSSVALKNFGKLSTNDIKSYLSMGGYSGLKLALKLFRDEVISKINDVGLKDLLNRDVYSKWKTVLQSDAEKKYFVCNGADYGLGIWNNILIKNNPHSIIEGMLIGAYATNASMGYIYIDNSDVETQKSLINAINELYKKNMLGKDILDSDFSFDIEVITGEKTTMSLINSALINRIEGRKFTPDVKSESLQINRIKDCPTIIERAEVLSKVTALMINGQDWYKDISKIGTKIIQLDGDVKQSCIVEIPIGMKFNEIIQKYGEGLKESSSIKYILAGGYAGGLLSNEELDSQFTLELFNQKNILIDSGLLYVFEESNNCIIDLLSKCYDENKNESCGKCVLCREGNIQTATILNDIVSGKGKSSDLELLQELGKDMQLSLCEFGQWSSTPLITGLDNFLIDFEKHIKKKRCDASICHGYITYHILGEKCQGCGICLQKCPEDAIVGDEGMIHVIDEFDCIKCGICIEVCPLEYSAIVKAGNDKPDTPDEPIPVGSYKPGRRRRRRR